MGKTVEITVPDGYKIQRTEERIPLDTAGFLQTKRQHRYTSARREGDWAILEKHRILCPCCGSGTPAYPRFLGPKYADEVYDRVPRQEISSWMNPQFSLFSEDGDTLVLNQVVSPEKFTCPKCDMRSAPAKRDVTVTIGEDGSKVWISSIVVDMKQVFGMMMGSSREAVSLRFPMREMVTFDVEKGTVELQITDGSGAVLRVRDMINEGKGPQKPAIFPWLIGIHPVGRCFARAFRRVYGGPLPFPKQELSGAAYVEMTRFPHFPREFYEAIPYDLETWALDEEFLSVAGRLSDASLLPEVYASSALPSVKSVRRLFFANPGFFFYIKEAEALAEVFKDCNIFVRVLSRQYVYDMLAFLHMYPGALVFFRDYAHRRGQELLSRKMEEDFQWLSNYAIRYCAMSPGVRRHEQKNWKRKWQEEEERELRYSVPMRPGFNAIRDGQTVDGYTFLFLRSRLAYAEAARELENCLQQWHSGSNPVVVVKKGGVYKAAIEVKNSTVIQQRAIRNEPVEDDPPLLDAIEKWKAANKLTDREYEPYDDDDEEEGLPF